MFLSRLTSDRIDLPRVSLMANRINQRIISLSAALCLMIGSSPIDGMIIPDSKLVPSPTILSMKELTPLQQEQQINAQHQDTIDIIDVNSPYYRYPGKAMMFSLVIPGAGQLYIGRPKRTAVFIGIEIIALMAWHNYNERGENGLNEFMDFADEHWDFERWLNSANNYLGGPWGSGEGQIYVGTAGTHYLELFVEDMNDDGQPEWFGNTRDDSPRLLQIMSSDTSSFLQVKKNNEYYENIGKYNQFFSGWEDASPDTSEGGIWFEERSSGLIAMTLHRSKYVNMRSDANHLMSAASYAISALMFNHVISAIDAIFVTANWNREHASRLSSRLLYNPASSHGIGGIQLTLSW